MDIVTKTFDGQPDQVLNDLVDNLPQLILATGIAAAKTKYPSKGIYLDIIEILVRFMMG